MKMKDQNVRKKVVVRHLPPGMSQAAFKEQIDMRFAGRYDWFVYRPGKASHKKQVYSHAFINFNTPEGVLEFAEAFNGHFFVNEKGTHYKAIVEYAPSQWVPKPTTDAREGSIFQDGEYLEFVEMLAKPVENLPSADIQLERKEAERAASGMKDTYVVTPLMDFVRQKRATKVGAQRSVVSGGKLARRTGGAVTGSGSHRRGGADRRRPATYVLRDSSKVSSGKEKPTYILVSRQDEHTDSDHQSHSVEGLEDEAGQTGKNAVIESTGLVGTGDGGKKKLLLNKKDKEPVNGRIAEVSFSNSSNAVAASRRSAFYTKGSPVIQQYGIASNHQAITSPSKGSPGVPIIKQHQRRDSSGRIMKGNTANKDIQQSSQLQPAIEQQNHSTYIPRDTRKSLDELASDTHVSLAINEKQDRRMRNKDRPDRPVWTARRRSNGIASDELASSETSVCSQAAAQVNIEGMIGTDTEGKLPTENFAGASSTVMFKSHNAESVTASHLRSVRTSNTVERPSAQGEIKAEKMLLRSGDIRIQGTGRTIPAGENGVHRQILRRPTKDNDGPSNGAEVKPSKRANASGYGGHEKQVWVAVQKSGSSS